MGGTFFFSAAAIFRVTKISGNISQYSVKGFNLNVTDYLLKPFELEYFLIAVNKVKTGLTENIIQVKPGDKRLPVSGCAKKEDENFIF